MTDSHLDAESFFLTSYHNTICSSATRYVGVVVWRSMRPS